MSRKLGPRWTVSVGRRRRGRAHQPGGRDRSITACIGLPLTAKYDGSNDLLVPTRGIRATFSVTPTGAFPVEGAQSTAGFLITQVQASTYLDLSGNGHSVLALSGPRSAARSARRRARCRRTSASMPAAARRCAATNTRPSGPLFPDETPMGGLSLTAGTVEFRQRVWGPVGAVAFVDAGQVGTTPAPVHRHVAGRRRARARATTRRSGRSGSMSRCRSTARRAATRSSSISDWAKRSDAARAAASWPGSSASLVAIPVVAVAAVLVLANLPVGRNFITGHLGGLTGGMVEADGLAGRFPDRLRLRHVALRDCAGRLGRWSRTSASTGRRSTSLSKTVHDRRADRRRRACLPPAGLRAGEAGSLGPEQQRLFSLPVAGGARPAACGPAGARRAGRRRRGRACRWTAARTLPSLERGERHARHCSGSTVPGSYHARRHASTPPTSRPISMPRSPRAG